MTTFKSMNTMAAVIAALFTASATMAGQYNVNLEKSTSGYEMNVEVSNFNIGEANVTMLSFGAIFNEGKPADLNAGIALDFGDHLSFSLEAGHNPEGGEFEFGLIVSATDMVSPYGLLNFGLSWEDDVIAGSLALTDGQFWGLDNVSFSASLNASDEGAFGSLDLTGEAGYGFDLAANADINFDYLEKSTFSVTISGDF